MNPNATPFQSAKPTSQSRNKVLQCAIEAPFAPILMLTDEEKQSMRFRSRIRENMSLPDFQAALTAISIAEFVLE
jgi:hypothetical protein